MELLEHPSVLRPAVVEPDEAAARRTLRDQVARLERELAAAVCAAYPAVAAPTVSARRPGPRLLGLAELEALRDDLAERLRELRSDLAAQAERQQAARLRLERMLLAPGDHRWMRVGNEDLGLPGCKHWHVRPRLGLIGMLAGWWHVRVSSGCPLAEGRWPTPPPRPPRLRPQAVGTATRPALATPVAAA